MTSGTDPDIEKLRKTSRVLDSEFQVPGTNVTFGVDPIIGLVPVLGDYLGLALSLYVVLGAWRAGLPPRALARMLLNVGVEAVVGSVPVIGDAFDFVWKANERNVAVAETYVESPREAGRRDARFLAGAIGFAVAAVVLLAAVVVVLLALALYGLLRYIGSPV